MARAPLSSLHSLLFSVDMHEVGIHTGISSQIRTKLRDWAVGQARAGCYFQAAMSSNDSKTLYMPIPYYLQHYLILISYAMIHFQDHTLDAEF